MPIPIVVDTYAWIEFFRGTSAGKKLIDFFDKELITPSIAIAELSFKYEKEKIDFTNRLNFIKTKSKICFLDERLASVAGKIRYERKHINGWGVVDSIILSTARFFKAKIITGDEHFRDLKESIMVK